MLSITTCNPSEVTAFRQKRGFISQLKKLYCSMTMQSTLLTVL